MVVGSHGDRGGVGVTHHGMVIRGWGLGGKAEVFP